MGFRQIRGYVRKKAFFLSYLDFPSAVRALRKRAKKSGKRAKKADFGRFPGREIGQTTLKPPFVTPPFAAIQSAVPYFIWKCFGSVGRDFHADGDVFRASFRGEEDDKSLISQITSTRPRHRQISIAWC